MKHILGLARDEIDRQLAPKDLTNAQWDPLFKLYNGHANTVAELARHCSLDAGAMTRMLDRLEAKNLCQRQRSEVDRRVVNLVLTPEGQEAAAAIPDALCHTMNSLLAGFDAQEFAALTSYLQRILVNAKALQDRAAAQTPASSKTGPQA
ncbi:MarR family transcriptional regulator [Curvibacter sp. CHRR-16]|nr:MarR family transcriptional regulator [Curvibacter sp. CHRR-16]